MKQLSQSTNTGHHWLNNVHEQRKKRSFDLGKRTIDKLMELRIPVTLQNINQKSKELDTSGKGLHINTVKTNEELYAYYKEHSKTYKVKQNQKKPKPITAIDDTYLRKISTERNLSNVRRKYMKLSKEELVNQLIGVEQYIAENNIKWVTKHFESFN